MQETAKIWMNGELVDWADATVHVGVHGLHYGTGVFEGIRAYETPKGPAVFRLAEHMQRLHDSARLLYMELPYSVEELRDGDARPRARERAARLLHPADRVLRLRLARRAHARQPGRDGDHELAVGRLPRRGLAREGHHREDLLLEAGRPERDPARRRRRPASTSTRCSRRPRRSAAATTRGSCSPTTGFVADGPGENIFVVKDGRILTPPLSTSILPGITRDSVIEIARDLGYVVEETDVPAIRSRYTSASHVAPTTLK